MKAVHKYLVGFGIIFAALVILSLSSGNVSADTHTWISDGAATSSTGAAWDSGTAPETGDDLVFNALHQGDCTIDQALTFNNITLSTGFTGKVSQGNVEFGYQNLLQQSGGWVGKSPTYWQTCHNSFVRTGGVDSFSTVLLKMDGEGGVLTKTGTGTLLIDKIWVQANITLTDHLDINSWIIDSGKTLTLNGGEYRCQTWVGLNNAWLNNGIVAGTGSIQLRFYTASASFALGTINIPVKMAGAPTAERTLTLTEDTVLGSTLQIISENANNLVIATAGHSLQATTITLSNHGVLNLSSSTVQCHSFNPSLGTLIEDGTSRIIITGSGGSMTFGSSQAVSNIEVRATPLTFTWTVTATAGTYNWTVTNLNASRFYNLYIDGVLQPQISSDEEGKISMSRDSWSTHTYVLLEIASITPTDSSYDVLEDGYFTLELEADQTGTWSIITDAYWLEINGKICYGTPDDAEIGIYWLNATLSNANGIGYRNYTITVTNHFEFTSVPIATTPVWSLYNYYATVDEPDVTFYITTNSTEITGNSSLGLVLGRPMGMEPIAVSIMAINALGEVIYQNYTLQITLAEGSITDQQVMIVLLSVAILGILTMLACFKIEQLKPIAGMGWVACGLFVFYQYDVIFLFLSVVVGLYLLLTGVMEYYG